MDNKKIDDYVEILQNKFLLKEGDFLNTFGQSLEKLSRLEPGSKEYFIASEKMALFVEPFINNISMDERLENLINRLYLLEKLSLETLSSICGLEENKMKSFVNGEFSSLNDKEKYNCFGTLTTLYNILKNIKSPDFLKYDSN